MHIETISSSVVEASSYLKCRVGWRSVREFIRIVKVRPYLEAAR